MKKVNCKITTLSPFHTGSDSKDGNTMSLRKESVVCYDNKRIVTPFETEEDLNKAILLILYSYYKSMDKDFKSGPNSYGGYSLFFAFVRKSLSSSASWIEFQSQLLDFINCDNVAKWFRDELRKTTKILEYDWFKSVFKKNQKFLRTELQFYVQEENEKNADDFIRDLEFCKYSIVEKGFELKPISVEVPVITGNSITGKIRRVVFDSFLDLIETKREELKNQLILELLIQGGRNLHKTGSAEKGLMPNIPGTISDFYYTSDGVVNIQNRIILNRLLPYLALLGYSFGNQTGESLFITNYAKLNCKENNTGELHSTDLIDVMFYTHKDEISNFSHEFTKPTDSTAQMKFDVEVVKSNAIFETSFILALPEQKNDDELMIESCFYWILETFQQNASLGARNNRGEGSLKVEYNIDIINKSKLFVDYIKKNKNQIRNYLQID
jgi:hypothetical protein